MHTPKDKPDIVFESKKKGFRMEDAAKQYGVGLSTVYQIVQDLNECFYEPPSRLVTPRKRPAEDDDDSGESRNCCPR